MAAISTAMTERNRERGKGERKRERIDFVRIFQRAREMKLVKRSPMSRDSPAVLGKILLLNYGESRGVFFFKTITSFQDNTYRSDLR